MGRSPAAASSPRPALPSAAAITALLAAAVGGLAACRAGAGAGAADGASAVGTRLGSEGEPDAAAVRSAGESAERAQPFVLYASADLRGAIEPCGCVGGQYGGMPRRATYLRADRRGEDVYLDLGDLVSGESPLQVSLLEASLEALRASGCDALVPGEAELRLGSRFEELAARLGPPVVCANLRRRSDGSAVFPPVREVALAGGRRVAIVGVTTASGAASHDYLVDPPLESARAAIAGLDGPTAVVVAASASASEARKLAAGLRGVVLVAASHAGIDSPALERGAGAPVALAGRFGEFVARVAFDEDFAVAEGRRVWIGDDLAEAPDVVAIVARHRARVAARNQDLPRRIAEGFAASGAAGSDTCRPCHEDVHAAWRSSVHARTEGLLVPRRATRDPECLPCHYLDVPPSAASAGDDPGGIGCEACHGPSRRHAESARRTAAGGPPPERTPGVSADACRRCHDRQHSPRFSFDEYAKRAAHRR